jgi:uncharacterized protein (TIGR02145 family)
MPNCPEIAETAQTWNSSDNTGTSPYNHPSEKLKILATNLGVENENAADFGDLYQWGRIADRHQTIGWRSSGIIAKIVAFDAATIANKIAKTAGITIAYDSNSTATEGGIPFLQITDNDPCPIGWHVPTRYEWGAIATGEPAITAVNSSTGKYDGATINTWRLPSTSTSIVGSTNHAGGVVVRPPTVKEFFCPLPVITATAMVRWVILARTIWVSTVATCTPVATTTTRQTDFQSAV